MTRAVIGGVLGGIAMWLVGFLFWGTPLNRIGFTVADDAANAAVQVALAERLGPTGTGTYAVPWPGTQLGSGLFSQGPIATIHYTAAGFPVADTGALIGGLVLAVLASLAVAFALRRISAAMSVGERLVLVALFALAIAGYVDLGQPVFNHAPWRYHIYLFVSDLLSFVAAGAVIAWFLPRPVAATAAPPV